ncbi:MAG: M20/M25/M40 family metallo-hydrolase [Gammaproteobacteria bacterium]|nr:MAG: M20/M25/M40 family metallo-hydrolase [Gammaproteobacteria bacterium]
MIIVTMPGESYDRALPALSAEQTQLRDNLRGHVETLAGTIGERNLHHYAALEAAARYISTVFESIKYQPNLQSFSVQGRTVSNIEVVKAGTERPDEIVVVGAHYDSVAGSPGANDNATGVAGMLELARILRPQQLSRSVHLVAFVNEEPPYSYTSAMGSRRYAERAASKGERITAMLSLETIGYYSDEEDSQHYPFPFGRFYPDKGNFIGFVGNLRSRKLVRRAIASFRSHANFPSEGLAAPGWVTGVGWSDHWSFWKSGYPGIMVTDTALFRYPQYHSSADRPGIVVYDSFARVVHGLAGVVRDLANVE